MAVACALAGRAAADDTPSYLEGIYGWYEGGAAMVESARLQDFFGEPLDGNEVKFDTGFHFGIGIGRQLSRLVKVEVESGYHYNELGSIDGATDSSGKLQRIPVLGNVVLQFPNKSRFIPMIGAGVGAQWAEFDAQNVTLGLTTIQDDSDTWAFTYQGFAGVRYMFRENMSLGFFYRYSVADGPSWEFDGVPGNLKLDDVRTHTFSLHFGWDF